MSEFTETEVYARLIDAVKTAEGCAQQLAHLRKDARWLSVRTVFENARQRITLLAMRKVA